MVKLERPKAPESWGKIFVEIGGKVFLSYKVKVCGRQRMLSQKISKLAFEIDQSHGNQKEVYQELKAALDLWQRSHEGNLG